MSTVIQLSPTPWRIHRRNRCLWTLVGRPSAACPSRGGHAGTRPPRRQRPRACCCSRSRHRRLDYTGLQLVFQPVDSPRMLMVGTQTYVCVGFLRFESIRSRRASTQRQPPCRMRVPPGWPWLPLSSPLLWRAPCKLDTGTATEHHRSSSVARARGRPGDSVTQWCLPRRLPRTVAGNDVAHGSQCAGGRRHRGTQPDALPAAERP